MLGIKLRNWMENHILKPRKKGNKNKNNAVGNTAETYLITTHPTAKDYAFNNCELNHPKKTQNNQKPNTNNASSPQSIANGATNGNSGNSIVSSPVRRREISPIQNSNLSRYGWLSPKLEYGNHDDTTQTSSYIFSSDGHIFDKARRNSIEPNTIGRHKNCYDQQREKEKEFSIQYQLNNSTSSCSSLTWSTGSKESFVRSNRNQGCHKSRQVRTIRTKQANDLRGETCEDFGTIVRQSSKCNNHQDCQPERPKSEQFYTTQHHSMETSAGYGRLLPSKLANSMLENFPGAIISCNQPPPYCLPTVFPPTKSSYNSLSDYKTTIPVNSIQEGISSTCVESIYSNQSNSGQPLISLSSPESAYSTGYSTDGNSQNVSHTPTEIHLNGRKSINSMVVEGQRYKFGLNKIEEMSPLDPLPKTSFVQTNNESNERYEMLTNNLTNRVETKISNSNQNCLMEQQQQFLLASSPRQRCRIRTNPWISTIEPLIGNDSCNQMRKSNLADGMNSTNSSKSYENSPILGVVNHLSGCSITDNSNYNKLGNHSRITGNDYETFRHSSKYFSDNLLTCLDHNKDRKVKKEDELIEKFVRNYSFEKETDILSNESDLNEHQLSNDTGLDAEDECDSDSDDSSNSISDKYGQKLLNVSLTNSVRRKRYLKTSKKNSVKDRNYQRFRDNRKSRETRSAGGTPVCLRKHTISVERYNNEFKGNYLNERSNSMILDDEQRQQQPLLDNDDERILSKADLEADMKYRQLIIEAEILLVTLGHSMQSLPQKTLSSSPSKLQAPLPKKPHKQTIHQKANMKHQLDENKKLTANTDGKLRTLKTVTNSKDYRINNLSSPQRTHLTNFLNQNNSFADFKITNRLTNKHFNRLSSH